MKYAEDIEAMVSNPARKAEINAWHEAQERKMQSEMVRGASCRPHSAFCSG
jgi:hypothetical protein